MLRNYILCQRKIKYQKLAFKACHLPLCSCTLLRKFKTNIYRNETVQPCSQFQHSCICERSIIFSRSVRLFGWIAFEDWLWEYINRSQLHECWNWKQGPENICFEFSVQCICSASCNRLLIFNYNILFYFAALFFR